MLINTADVCRLSGISWAKLADWVRRGLIIPAAKGSKGYGKSHKFSLLQAIGLAFTAPLGWGADTTTEAVAEFEKMDEDRVVAWIMGEKQKELSPWAEERIAHTKAVRTVIPSPLLFSPVEDGRFVRRAEEGMARARQVVEWFRAAAKEGNQVRTVGKLPTPASVLSRVKK